MIVAKAEGPADVFESIGAVQRTHRCHLQAARSASSRSDRSNRRPQACSRPNGRCCSSANRAILECPNVCRTTQRLSPAFLYSLICGTIRETTDRTPGADMRGTSTRWTRSAARVAALALGVPALLAAVAVAQPAVSHHSGVSVRADAIWTNSVHPGPNDAIWTV